MKPSIRKFLIPAIPVVLVIIILTLQRNLFKKIDTGETVSESGRDMNTKILSETRSVSSSDVSIEKPVYSGMFSVQEYNTDNLPLPPAPDGNGYKLFDTEDGTLVLRKLEPSPMAAAGKCLDLILACYQPGARNIAGCFEHVPTCQNDTPWLEDTFCCPEGCLKRYQELLAEGKSDGDALSDALLQEPSCIPGLDDLLKGQWHS